MIIFRCASHLEQNWPDKGSQDGNIDTVLSLPKTKQKKFKLYSKQAQLNEGRFVEGRNYCTCVLAKHQGQEACTFREFK